MKVTEIGIAESYTISDIKPNKATMEILERHYGGQLPFEEAKASKNYRELHLFYREVLIGRVNDDGAIVAPVKKYSRHNKPYCCSSPLKSLNKGLYCEVCASYYKLK